MTRSAGPACIHRFPQGDGRPVGAGEWLQHLASRRCRPAECLCARRALALVPILATHDAADTDSSWPVPYTTTVPTQALGLLNGEFANEQAASSRPVWHGNVRAIWKRRSSGRFPSRPRATRGGAKSRGRGVCREADQRVALDRQTVRPVLSHGPECERLPLPGLILMGAIPMEQQYNSPALPVRSARGSFCGRTRREMLWEIGGGFGRSPSRRCWAKDSWTVRPSRPTG